MDGKPVLSREEFPTLSLPSGEFRPTLIAFVLDLMRGRIPEEEIEAEAIAQIRRVQAAGIEVTHIDTHKHTHMFVRVLRPLLRAARAVRSDGDPQSFRAGLGAGPRPQTLRSLRRWQVKLLRTAA